MQEKIDHINYKSKRILRSKIVKHKQIHHTMSFFQKTYCSLIGPSRIFPNYFIIGAAKCGTTSLYDYLTQHPCINSSLTKEPRYFDKYYYRGLNWYKTHYPSTMRKWFSTKINKKPFLVIDATPRYLDHPHTPYRIKNTIPSAKFIILLRNPIDRAYSHWNMRWGKKKESLSFEDAINTESERIGKEFEKMEDDRNYYSSDYFHHGYLERGIYVNKLKHWMSVFPQEKFLIIQSEKLFQNPQEEYDKVLSFFGLSGWKLKDTSAKGSRVYNKPEMSSEIRKQLSDFFKPHNERLFKFLDTKYDWD